MTFNTDDYEKGGEICLDALERMQNGELDQQSGLAAFLTTAMHATYAMAPSEEIADEMIAQARNIAEKDWAAEKEGK